MNPRLAAVLSPCFLLTACDGAGSSPVDDTGGGTGTTPLEIPEDNVANALGDCLGYYRPPEEYPNQLAQGTELQRYTLQDPQAACNDGSPAVMYVRAATSDALADVWSIHLQGGGGCSSYLSCAIRWCGLDYYDSSKMSSVGLPLEIGAFGIFDADPANVLAGANQVFFYYCTSDSWRGQGSAAYDPDDLEIPAELPVELPEELPSYTMFRRGHTIVASGLDELEAGVVADDGEALPSLADASLVIWNGTSGGSVGARAHADYVRARLAPRGTEVVAIFDAANFPLSEHMPEPYASALDELKAQGWQQSQDTDDTLPFMDESCWEHLGGTADEGDCHDLDYVAMNHITTPFFMRQDLRDLGGGPELIGMPEDDYQESVVSMLEALADLPTTAVEGDAIEVVPGAYGPNCAQHVALESTSWWAVSTLQDDGGAEWSFQQAVLAWKDGQSIALIDAPNSGNADGPGSTCAAVDDER